MHERSLTGVDLNLLVALDALLEERNVTRAAQRLGLTQSAMSHVLRRLRALFDDPLFVRTPRGMLPTPRAQQLATPVRQILTDIDKTIHNKLQFDPMVEQRTFTIVMSDYVEFVLLPPLLAHLSKSASGINISVRVAIQDVERALEDGRVDLVIGRFDQEMRSVYRQRLFEEEFVCVVRASHPVVKRSLTLDHYVNLPHLLVSPRGIKAGGIVDDELAKLGKQRRIALSVPHFLIAPHVIASSDLILTMVARMARAYASLLPLRIVTPPIKMPGFTLNQFWHERQHHDPGHTWLRGVLVEICRTI
jgi:DNA-binding transcriptional LysR family regulator